MSGISHTPPGTHKKGLPMLQLKKIRKEYKTGDLVQTALNDVSLNLRDIEFVAILGPSGSGKTTLLNIIGGLDRYDSGDLVINGISTKKYTDRDWDSYRNHTVGFVFQSYNLFANKTALKNVAEGLIVGRKMPKEKAREIAMKALEKVGLADRSDAYPAQLSGGEQQRVSIARALAKNPKLLLCDEPTGALDYNTGKSILKLLQNMCREKGMTVIIITHNQALAPMADRLIHIKNGQVARMESNENPTSIDEIEW